MTQPATISNELLDKLRMLDRNDPSFEFSFKSLQREISRLRKVEPWAAYMLEGVLYSKVFDIENSQKAHENSIKFSNAALAAYANYASSMSRVGQHDEMLRASEYVLKHNRLEEGIVRFAMIGAIFLGKIDKAAEIKERCASDYSDNNQELKNLFDAEGILSAFFQKDEGYLALYKSAMNSVRNISQQKKHSITFCSVEVEHDSAGEMLYVTIGVNADGHAVGEMNDEIAESLAERSVTENKWDRVVPYCIPVTFESSGTVCL